MRAGAALGAGLAGLGAVAYLATATARDLHAVAPAERAALYQHALEGLRAFCTGRTTGAVDEHCRELATFAAEFEECDATCGALVHHVLDRIATR